MIIKVDTSGLGNSSCAAPIRVSGLGSIRASLVERILLELAEAMNQPASLKDKELETIRNWNNAYPHKLHGAAALQLGPES